MAAHADNVRNSSAGIIHMFTDSDCVICSVAIYIPGFGSLALATTCLGKPVVSRPSEYGLLGILTSGLHCLSAAAMYWSRVTIADLEIDALITHQHFAIHFWQSTDMPISDVLPLVLLQDLGL